MNRVAITISSAAVVSILGLFALRPPADEQPDGNPGGVAQTPVFTLVEYTSPIPTEAAQIQATPAADPIAIAGLVTETDQTDVDFETLAAAVPLGQIPATLARLTQSE